MKKNNNNKKKKKKKKEPNIKDLNLTFSLSYIIGDILK